MTDWIAFGAALIIAIGGGILGFSLGVEYQKVRVARFWRENSERMRRASETADRTRRASRRRQNSEGSEV